MIMLTHQERRSLVVNIEIPRDKYVYGEVHVDELDKGLDLGITGALRQAALTGCTRQIKAWNLAMPAVEPLVLDFGLGEFYKTGLIEYWIANEIVAGYCGKFLFLFDGQTCPKHHHRMKLETFFIVKGRVRMDYAGAVCELGEGGTLLVECQKPHQIIGLGPALILEISKPCVVADNFFADPRIPIGGNYPSGQGAQS